MSTITTAAVGRKVQSLSTNHNSRGGILKRTCRGIVPRGRPDTSIRVIVMGRVEDDVSERVERNISLLLRQAFEWGLFVSGYGCVPHSAPPP